MRVLIVEDEVKINSFISQVLQSMGHATDSVQTVKDAIEHFSIASYDLVILDLMLPDGSGLDVCKKIKATNGNVPILILTTLSQVVDKVSGLDAGADDYLTKPFIVEELQARVRALLRRNNSGQGTQLVCEDLSLDLIHHHAIRGGETIKLTTKEYSLLEYFMRNPGRPLSRAQIAQHVWDMHFDPGSNVVDVYIKQLRKKIESNGSKKLIKTIIGLGYIFNEK